MKLQSGHASCKLVEGRIQIEIEIEIEIQIEIDYDADYDADYDLGTESVVALLFFGDLEHRL